MRRIKKKIKGIKISRYSLGDAWQDFKKENDLKKLYKPYKHFKKVNLRGRKITLPLVDLRKNKKGSIILSAIVSVAILLVFALFVSIYYFGQPNVDSPMRIDVWRMIL